MVRVASIDIGTVSVRLAVADVEDGKVLRCAKQSRICDLGEGLASSGKLSQAACERVLSAVDDYLAAAKSANAAYACCTLTSAARDASNSDDLLSELEARKLHPEVIPGRVEGSLTFLGVVRDFPGERIVVADNGGGSTELAVGSLAVSAEGVPEDLNLEFVRSVDVGCRRVTEQCLPGVGSATEEMLASARAFCDKRFAADIPWREDGAARGGAAGGAAAGTGVAVGDGVAAAADVAAAAGDYRGDNPLCGVARPARLVAVGGTVTSLVAIDAALDPYDSSYVHLHELTASQVDDLIATLAQLSVEERRHVVGLQAKRAPVILAGAVVIRELMRSAGFDRLTVSESDLLFGLSAVAAAAAGDAGGVSPVNWLPQLTRLS